MYSYVKVITLLWEYSAVMFRFLFHSHVLARGNIESKRAGPRRRASETELFFFRRAAGIRRRAGGSSVRHDTRDGPRISHRARARIRRARGRILDRRGRVRVAGSRGWWRAPGSRSALAGARLDVRRSLLGLRRGPRQVRAVHRHARRCLGVRTGTRHGRDMRVGVARDGRRARPRQLSFRRAASRAHGVRRGRRGSEPRRGGDGGARRVPRLPRLLLRRRLCAGRVGGHARARGRRGPGFEPGRRGARGGGGGRVRARAFRRRASRRGRRTSPPRRTPPTPPTRRRR